MQGEKTMTAISKIIRELEKRITDLENELTLIKHPSPGCPNPPQLYPVPIVPHPLGCWCILCRTTTPTWTITNDDSSGGLLC